MDKHSTISYHAAGPTLARRLERMAAGHAPVRASCPDEEQENRRAFHVVGGGVVLLLFLLGGGYLAFVPRNAGSLRPLAASAVDFPATLPPNSSTQAPVQMLPQAARPLDWSELCLMLRAGLRDEEIIAAAAAKQLVCEIGPVQRRVLRQLGAGERLISYLENCPRFAASTVPNNPRVVVTAPSLPELPAGGVAAARAAVSTDGAIDYGAKDREIQSLKEQIDALDERMRIIRNNPRGSPERWHYFGPGNAWVNQAALSKYLDLLDKERNELRRRKWRLEGR